MTPIHLLDKPSAIARATRKPIHVAFAVAAISLASPTSAQSCRAADANSAFMIADLKRLVGSMDPQDAHQRRDLRIPVVDTSTIVLVTHTPTCSRALTAFLTTLPTSHPTPLPTDVYVAKVGNVYVAMHPAPPGETGSPYAVLDSRYNVLAKYSL